MPSNPSASRKEQTWDTFIKMERLLNIIGMNTHDVVRTWFHNDRILEWYDEFNEVRNRFFKERKVFDGLLPASTGIGGRNPSGSALVASAMAVHPLTKSFTVKELSSPLQCPATFYGSSFSRAVEIITPDLHRVLVSGTASIGEGGRTIHIDDAKSQVSFTLDVIKAILTTRGLNYNDVVRAIAYFKNSDDAHILEEKCKKTNMPVIIAESDICRDDLLFEIEVDAVSIA